MKPWPAFFNGFLIASVFLIRSSHSDDGVYSGKSSLFDEVTNEKHIHRLRVKTGTPIALKCHKGSASWEFKPCHTNSFGLCESQDRSTPWRKLNLTKSRLAFDSAQKNLTGIYRCFDRSSVKRIFVVDVVPPGYDGPPPHVAPLRTSNLTDQANMEFTIQCNVTSEIPPTIIWFKSCYGNKCDIHYNKLCYCHINNSIPTYSLGNVYLSKLSIFNARDVDSGIYACLAITQYGENSQNVTISVPRSKLREQTESFSLLFLIPVALVLVPFLIWLCYNRRKRKNILVVVEQQKQLIRPVVRINTDANQII